MYEGSQAERTENAVHFPLYVLEAWWREECEGEIADPVKKGGEGYGFAADIKGNDFCRIYPASWSAIQLANRVTTKDGMDLPPSRRIYGNKKIGACNNSLGSPGIRNDPSHARDTVEPTGNFMAVRGHQSGFGKQKNSHEEGSHHHEPAPWPSVHKHKRRDCQHDVYNILDRGSQEICAA